MSERILRENPYETIIGFKDNHDGTVTVSSIYDTSHPECPIITIKCESLDIEAKIKIKGK